MGYVRSKPDHLAPKLLAIRQALGLSQSEMVQQLEFQTSGARISEYETGKREPNLLVLLSYARVAKIRVELLIDDNLSLPDRFASGE